MDAFYKNTNRIILIIKYKIATTSNAVAGLLTRKNDNQFMHTLHNLNLGSNQSSTSNNDHVKHTTNFALNRKHKQSSRLNPLPLSIISLNKQTQRATQSKIILNHDEN